MPGILAEPILVLARLRQGVHFSCAYCLKPGRGEEERGRKRRQGFLPCTGLRSWPHLLRIASQAGSWFVQAVGTVVAAHTLLDLVKAPLRKWPGGAACLVCTAPSRPLTHRQKPTRLPFQLPSLALSSSAPPRYEAGGTKERLRSRCLASSATTPNLSRPRTPVA